MKPMDLATVTALSDDEARAYFESIRWPNGPRCAHCGSENVVRLAPPKTKNTRPNLLKCRACRKPFSITVGTIFHRSHITLRQWLIAFQMMCASKKGVSALQLQRQLGLKSYQSAWHLAHRVRWAMRQEPLAGMLRGDVQIDETYVGGKWKNRHASRRKPGGVRFSWHDTKAPVMGFIDSQGRGYAKPIDRADADTLKAAIREVVDRSARILTDDHGGYRGIGSEFAGGHETVAHLRGEYARMGGVTTNGIESYFALLKRSVMGAWHHVSKRHLARYCDELSFRWTLRKSTDGERMIEALRQTEGKRLTYAETVK